MQWDKEDCFLIPPEFNAPYVYNNPTSVKCNAKDEFVGAPFYEDGEYEGGCHECSEVRGCPTAVPSAPPSHYPTLRPTMPTKTPTAATYPTDAPTLTPSPPPTFSPNHAPTTATPTAEPTRAPTKAEGFPVWASVAIGLISCIGLVLFGFFANEWVRRRLVRLRQGIVRRHGRGRGWGHLRDAQRFDGDGDADDGWADPPPPRPYRDDDRAGGGGRGSSRRQEVEMQYDPFRDRRGGGWDEWDEDAGSVASAGGNVPGPGPIVAEGAVTALDRSLQEGHEKAEKNDAATGEEEEAEGAKAEEGFELIINI